MGNRRKERRLVERNKVLIKSPFDAFYPKGINAFTFDISLGGARILSREFFDVGTVVKIQVELARTRQSVNIVAEVRWLNIREDDDIFELGVEFRHQISQSTLSLIRHLYSYEEGIPSMVA